MKYILLTTTSCSKCPGFKKELQDIGFFDKYQGEILDETHEFFADIANIYSIQSAPTILLFSEQYALKSMEENGEYPVEDFRTSDIPELLQFLKGLDQE